MTNGVATPTRSTATLQFLDVLELPFYWVGWLGEWPPPDEFCVLIGAASGMIRVWPLNEEPSKEVLAALDVETVSGHVYRQRFASEQDEPKPHGAEYVYDRPFDHTQEAR